MERRKEVHEPLIKAAQSWAAGKKTTAQARELRREAILLNHRHYLETIPLYRELAREEGCGPEATIGTIEQRLMLAAEVFKSYEPEWLDSGDFQRMTGWLATIYHKPLDLDMSGVDSIEGWIERLGAAGIDIVYSSGTSGAFSFVPRDEGDRALAKTANIACLAPLLARRQTGRALPGQLLKSATRLMPPGTLARLAGQRGLPDFDAVFLGFRQGRMGNQVLIEEFAPLFRRHHFLYESAVSGDALRILRRGARTEAELKILGELQNEVIGKKEANYLRIIEQLEQSTGGGQKLFVFGAPYQFQELGEVMASHKRRLTLKKGSVILFGGGWKSLTGETVGREGLVGMLSASLSVPPQMILEGYSMTEINMLMLRCDQGRFHIPPCIEPVIYDEGLNPMAGNDLKGIFGFLDPLAVAYPGFIISGDYVRMLDGECGCGLTGPALTEIGRARGQEIKGCGGIMASIRA
jgi:hypothetical protein